MDHTQCPICRGPLNQRSWCQQEDHCWEPLGQSCQYYRYSLSGKWFVIREFPGEVQVEMKTAQFLPNEPRMVLPAFAFDPADVIGTTKKIELLVSYQ